MNRKSFAAEIAVYAVFTALIALFLTMPFVFLLPLIVAAYLMDFKASAILSLAFGVISLTYAYTLAGATPVGMAFMNYPWIAIVPRLFIGPAAYGVKKLTQKAFANSNNFFLREVLPVSLSGAAASITNTALVLGCFAIFLRDFKVNGGYFVLLIPEMLISAVVEIFIAIVAAPLIVVTLKKAAKGLRIFEKYGQNSAAYKG